MGMKVVLDENIAEVVEKRSNRVVFVGHGEHKYWNFNFEVCNSQKRAFAMELGETEEVVEESVESGSNKPKVDDHEYAREKDSWSETEDDVAVINKDHDYVDTNYPNIQKLDEDGITEYLDLGADITIEQLDSLSETNHESIRKKLGLLYHVRLGHASMGYLEEAKKTYKFLENINFSEEIKDCEPCKLAKMTRKPHNKQREVSLKPLGRVHSDLIGIIKPTGAWKKGSYVVTFTDDLTRFTMIYCLVDKKGVASAFEDFIKTMRSFLCDRDAKVFYLRIDNGTEYMTAAMKDLLKREDIMVETCPADTPQLNGTAERINRTLLEKTRTLLVDSGLPLEFWELALYQVVHIHNRLPHKRLNFKSPYEMLCGKVPDIRHNLSVRLHSLS